MQSQRQNDKMKVTSVQARATWGGSLTTLKMEIKGSRNRSSREEEFPAATATVREELLHELLGQ